MSTINLESLLDLSPGDIVETLSLMGSLASESTLFQVESKTPESVTFRVMFHGVRIAKAVLTKTDKGVVWTSK